METALLQTCFTETLFVPILLSCPLQWTINTVSPANPLHVRSHTMAPLWSDKSAMMHSSLRNPWLFVRSQVKRSVSGMWCVKWWDQALMERKDFLSPISIPVWHVWHAISTNESHKTCMSWRCCLADGITSVHSQPLH